MEGSENAAYQYQFTQFATAGVITLWVYDYLVSTSEEVEVVWKRDGLRWLKVLFVSNRLLPIFQSYLIGKALLPLSPHTLSTQDCRVTLPLTIICNFIQIVLAHVIFTMRAYTISHRYPQLQILLGAALFVSLLISIISTALYIVDLLSAIQPGTTSSADHTCLDTKPASNLYPFIVSLSSISIEGLIFLITIYQTTRTRQGIADVQFARRFGILRRLYTQGVHYYLLTILFHIATILAPYIAPLGFQFLFPTIRFYVTTTLTSRFVLSLQREQIDSQLGQETRAAIVDKDRRTYSTMMMMRENGLRIRTIEEYTV